MDKIIQKAIEGGLIYDKNYNPTNADFCVLVCNSSFWQALGKTLEWIEICTNPDHTGIDSGLYGEDNQRLGCPLCGHNDDHVVESTRYQWRKHAFKFHEINLTEGWDKSVEYLNSLIK